MTASVILTADLSSCPHAILRCGVFALHHRPPYFVWTLRLQLFLLTKLIYATALVMPSWILERAQPTRVRSLANTITKPRNIRDNHQFLHKRRYRMRYQYPYPPYQEYLDFPKGDDPCPYCGGEIEWHDSDTYRCKLCMMEEDRHFIGCPIEGGQPDFCTDHHHYLCAQCENEPLEIDHTRNEWYCPVCDPEP